MLLMNSRLKTLLKFIFGAFEEGIHEIIPKRMDSLDMKIVENGFALVLFIVKVDQKRRRTGNSTYFHDIIRRFQLVHLYQEGTRYL